MTVKTAIYDLAKKIDVEIGGKRPHDVRIHDKRFYRKVLAQGSLGFGESYVNGWWDCDRIDDLVSRIFKIRMNETGMLAFGNLIELFMHRLFNFQTDNRAREVCTRHYDLGNDLFEEMLGSTMVYTCAYWPSSSTLEQAQQAKMDLVCRKIGLKPGMRLLDIGCGFGSFMKFAAEKYGAVCTGYSLSEGQSKYARENCKGLPIEIVMKDYREISGKFDRVVSIGMFEAVGYKNFRTYMEVVAKVLKDDGVFLLHTIGHNFSTTKGDRWVHRYIFPPNGMLPSISQIGKAIEHLFVMEDWHNFGPDYARTLLEWNSRFQKAWPKLSQTYPAEFKRMWEFYLLSFAGGFQARAWQLWQIVMTKPGLKQPDCRLS